MNGTQVEIRDLKAGDRVKATGNDTRGHTVTRSGTLLAKPMLVKAQDWGTRVKKWRLHIDAPGSEISRSNSVTLWPNERATRLDGGQHHRQGENR
ncbi:hypothetical protein ACFXAF_00485 [Kitasatospora sp. NPDC059463]|uniref:hypothetical protein n=1 Tax=unclassified Kitasatospora TaxID=2633591 RepID=UPI0036A19598